MALISRGSVLAVALLGCSAGEAASNTDSSNGTLGSSDAAIGVPRSEDGADASSPDGAAILDAPEEGDACSAPADAAPDAIVDPPMATVSLEDDAGKPVAFSRVSALQRGDAVTVTYLLTQVPGTGIAPLAFVYAPTADANQFTYVGVTTRDPLCGDGGSPAASGTAPPLVRTPAGLVSDRVVGASVPGLAGRYTATFANLRLATTNCQ